MWGRFWYGVVGAEDFEGFGIAGSSEGGGLLAGAERSVCEGGRVGLSWTGGKEWI